MLTDSPRVRLSVIVPVHDVEEFLPAFLTSLESNATPDEFVFVDDGSTDGSGAVVAEWVSSRPAGTAQVIRTENAGVSAARNVGMDAASGDWICFVDPDDVLGAGYVEQLRAFIDAHPDADLVATALHRIQEPDTRFRDNHPLRFRFAGGNRVAALSDDVFIMNAASVAFPRAAVLASGARFPTGLHASEDALFVTQYLLSLGRTPQAGFVADAHYGYRKRAARTSAVDRYRTDPSTFTERFRDGYEPLLHAASGAGEVPSWLQSMVLYEMQWLLPVQMDPKRFAGFLSEGERAATLRAISGCLRFVDDDRLLRYDASALPLESRLLILALTERPLWGWVGAYASMPRGWRQQVDVVSYESGTEAASGLQRTVWYPDYFGQQVLRAERVRVPDASTTVEVGGRIRPIVRPRAGETLVQAQDRHRRQIAGDDFLFLPALENEVYVRRTRPWADTASDRKPIRREQRRRGIWSKDAMIGRLFRPGHAWLIEHDPADPEDLAGRLLERVGGRVQAHMSNARGSSVAKDALRFGSMKHRIRRARAGLIVSTQISEAPAPRARIRGARVLVLRDTVDQASALAVRRIAPDVVVTADPSIADMIRRTDSCPHVIVDPSAADAGVLAELLLMLDGPARAPRPRGARLVR